MLVRHVVPLCAVIASVAIGSLARRPAPSDVRVAVLEPVEACAVTTSAGIAVCDLVVLPDESCDLIVSSLGNSDESFQIALHSQPVSHIERLAPRVMPLPRANRPGIRHAAFKPAAPIDTPDGLPTAQPRFERTFYLHVGATALEDPAGYIPVVTRLTAESRTSRVYLDHQIDGLPVSGDAMAELLRRLDEQTGPVRHLLGAHRDVDGDGKLAVVITPWLGRLRGGCTAANGFVRSSDFRHEIPRPFGNQADVLYLNADMPGGEALGALLTHEYTHAASISQRLPDNLHPAGLPDEHDWLNEAIAHVAEMECGAGWTNLDYRVARFLDDPTHCPLVVADYYRAGLWRDAGCRGATFLFLQWCVDRCGPDLLRELAMSPATGIDNIERAMGTDFTELYRHWTIALNDERLPSFPLRGQLGSQVLRGIGRIRWAADAPDCALSLRGTTSAFVRLTPPATTEARRITIAAHPAAKLQVTLVRRPEQSAGAGVLSRVPRAETARLAARRD